MVTNNMSQENNNTKAKPTDKPDKVGGGGKCKTSVQFKFTGLPDLPVDTELTLTLGEQSQKKVIEEELTDEIAFKISFKGDKKVKVISKAKPAPEDVYCPQPGETLTGSLVSSDGQINTAVSATIQKAKGGKPTKVSYDLGF